MMSLSEYQKMRKFEKTPEPEGGDQRQVTSEQEKPRSHVTSRKSLIFVIHDHYARQHHHDLRLEMDGVLKSWAVPKLTPEKVGVKRLAVQVEDHPLEYASFTGKIPEGEYGAGEVKIFDKGTYNIVHESKNSIEINFQGKKVKGIYALVQFKNEPKNWLFFKTNK